MKLIKELIYDLFADDNFLYFEVPDERGEDTQYMRYNEFNFEVINSEQYFKGRYGINYKKIMHYFKDRKASTVTDRNGDLFVCFYQESIIYKFDKNGLLLRKYNQMKDIDTVYDIALQDNSIWCAYPTSHTVKRFSLEDGKEELSVSEGSIGDDRGTIFCYPESILIEGDVMYVSDMGNKRICKVDLNTLKADSYIELPEPVLGYERLRSMEFVALDSGIYLL